MYIIGALLIIRRMSQSYELMLNVSFYLSKVYVFIPTFIYLGFSKFAVACCSMLLIVYCTLIITILTINCLDFLQITLTEKFIRYVDQGLEVLFSKLFIFAGFCSLYFWEALYPLLSASVDYNSVFSWLLIVLVFIIVVIPVMLISDWGFHFPSYLRGASDKNLVISELMYDYISTVTFFLRINIQLIRLLIGAFVFSFFDLYFIEGNYVTYENSEQYYEHQEGVASFILVYLNMFYYYFLRTIYEIGHMWMLLFIQTTAFFMIISMLFQFLYIFFLIDKLESFIKNKRKNK